MEFVFTYDQSGSNIMWLLVTLTVKNVQNIIYQDIDIGWAILSIHKEVNLWQKDLLLPSAYGEDFYYFFFVGVNDQLK